MNLQYVEQPQERGLMPPVPCDTLEIEGRYQGYMARQDADIRAFRKDEALRLPADLDYTVIGGLSAEVRQILSAAMPETLGAAARIPGVTPAAVLALLRHVRKGPERMAAAGHGESAA